MMKTIGQLFRETRETQGRTVREIAERIKVREEYLQAIERDSYKDLPQGPFGRGFVRAYAIELGLDPEHAQAVFRRDNQTSEKQGLLPKGMLHPVRRGKVLWFTPQIIGGIVIALGLLGFVVFQLLSLQQPPSLRVIEPIEQAQAKSPVFVRGLTTTDAIVTVNTKPVSLTQDGEFVTEVEFDSGEHTIVIEAKGRNGKRKIVERQVIIVE